MCPHTSIFGYSTVSGAAHSTIVTLMTPHNLEALTPMKVGELDVSISGKRIAIGLGTWGKPQGATPAPKRVSFDLGDGHWLVT